MELNVQSIKSQERLKRNKLYQVSADDPVITWIEEHTDSEPEIVDIEFNVPQGGCAVLANEYRNKDFRRARLRTFCAWYLTMKTSGFQRRSLTASAR